MCFPHPKDWSCGSCGLFSLSIVHAVPIIERHTFTAGNQMHACIIENGIIQLRVFTSLLGNYAPSAGHAFPHHQGACLPPRAHPRTVLSTTHPSALPALESAVDEGQGA